MAGLFQLKEIEAKKKALAAESELYRQTLKLQIHNLSLRATGMKRRYTLFNSPPLMRLLPMISALLGSPVGRMLLPKRRARWLRLATAALIGWQAYRKFAPLVQGFFSRRAASSQTVPETHGEAATEASS
jgi:hypothetical protein